MDFTASGILERMKQELKNEDSRIEGSFTMDNLQAVSEELARFNAMLIDPLKQEIADRKDETVTSGNERHYVQWAKEVVDENNKKVVGNARAYGLRDGSGVVYVALISMSADAPSESIVQLVEAYIQTKRPVGAIPIIVAASAIDIHISGEIEIRDGYDLETITAQAKTSIEQYFTEMAFKKNTTALNYHRIGIIISEIAGVSEITDYTLNGGEESIVAGYDEYFSLKGLVLHGS